MRIVDFLPRTVKQSELQSPPEADKQKEKRLHPEILLNMSCRAHFNLNALTY
jgi:hypothetical protein